MKQVVEVHIRDNGVIDVLTEDFDVLHTITGINTVELAESFIDWIDEQYDITGVFH